AAGSPNSAPTSRPSPAIASRPGAPPPSARAAPGASSVRALVTRNVLLLHARMAPPGSLHQNRGPAEARPARQESSFIRLPVRQGPPAARTRGTPAELPTGGTGRAGAGEVDTPGRMRAIDRLAGCGILEFDGARRGRGPQPWEATMRKPAVYGALALSAAMLTSPAWAQDSNQVRIGLGDIATVETLNLLIALERVKER